MISGLDLPGFYGYPFENIDGFMKNPISSRRGGIHLLIEPKIIETEKLLNGLIQALRTG